MALIMGFDLSAKKIAVVVTETATGTFFARTADLYAKGDTRQTPESLGAAIAFMSSFLTEVVQVSPQGYAYVESPLVGRGGSATTIKQAYVGGVVRGWLAHEGFNVYDAHPSTWRSALSITVPTSITGGSARTKALKSETLKAVSARWPKIVPVIGTDVDLLDAAAICLYGAGKAAAADRIARGDASVARRSVSRR